MATKRGARRMETGSGRGYGWIPDLPDHRDFLYGAVRRLPARLPRSVDLRRGCSPVEDQGQLGSCTGNALAGAVEFLEKRDGIPLVNVSRLFIYYNERVIEHTVADDAGAMIRDGIKTLVKQGTCSEKRWPYVIARFAVKPSAACYREAADHQVTAYARLQTLVAMRGRTRASRRTIGVRRRRSRLRTVSDPRSTWSASSVRSRSSRTRCSSASEASAAARVSASSSPRRWNASSSRRVSARDTSSSARARSRSAASR